MLKSITAVGSGGARQQLDIPSLLSSDKKDEVRAEANRWIKQLRLVRYGDVSMRERFTYRGDSLWWFTELYLHKMRRLEDALGVIATLEAVVERAPAHRLLVQCAGRTATEATRAFAQAHGLDVEITPEPERAARLDAGVLVGVSAVLSRLRPTARPPAGRARVAAFVHTAFWRTGDSSEHGREAYIGDVLNAITARVGADDLRLVGVGPRRNFRARRWWDPIVGRDTHRVTPVEHYARRTHLTEALALWRDRQRLADALTTGEDIRAAGWYGAYDLWPVLSAELAHVARVQWTWSARAMDEARAALTAIEPDVAVTYAEAGGWGRALVLEARRLSIPTVGVQHGFIYRHWLNYQHEADELRPLGDDRGFPVPTRTLLFDRYAETTLTTMGHFPSDALRVTGSPRLDELVARLEPLRADRVGIRRQLRVTDDGQLLVLAAKASEIAPYLDRLFAAVTSLHGVRLVIKPHPAEPRDVYVGRLPAGAPIEVLDPHTDLGRLLAVADGLVTMNSTVAIDALVLGVPALVVGLPNNLSPFVNAGVMAGTPDDGMRPAIERLLYDRTAREALLERGQAFAETYQMRADGNAAGRAANDILAHSRPQSYQP